VLGIFQQAGSPFVVNGERSGPSPAPLLGEHNEEIYCNELRLDKRDIEALGAGGVI
jgi:crotonobetainyl-CoA:carnitine CoA-transferase CaiB-like acyl-CoA transferase